MYRITDTAAVAIVVMLVMVLSLAACQPKPVQDGSVSDDGGAAGKRRIIIGTDSGADDAAAIILASSAAKSADADIDILGVTTLTGNADIDQPAAIILQGGQTVHLLCSFIW